MSKRTLVRCKNAGVHVGEIVHRDGQILVLKNSNRIWRWRGAHDLSFVAMKGVEREKYTRISCELPEITLNWADVCELIPLAEGVDLSEVYNE